MSRSLVVCFLIRDLYYICPAVSRQALDILVDGLRIKLLLDLSDCNYRYFQLFPPPLRVVLRANH